MTKIASTFRTSLLALMLGLSPFSVIAAGPAPINLLSASNFSILTKTGITSTGSHTSSITGNVGSSPITAAAMTTLFCSELTGTIFGVDAAYVGSGSQVCFAGNPPLSNMTFIDNAILAMDAAYVDAAGRTLPTATELGAGNIGGMTLAPGLYKWSTDVTIPSNVTLSGDANSVWIFQISGNLSIASAGSIPAGIKVLLAGGAQAGNIFWQVGGATGATLGTYSTFNGTILSAKQVIVQTGAVLNGRAFAGTQVTLDAATITLGNVISGTVGGTSTTTGTIGGNVGGTSTTTGTIGGGVGGTSTTTGTIGGCVGFTSTTTGTIGNSVGGTSSTTGTLGGSVGITSTTTCLVNFTSTTTGTIGGSVGGSSVGGTLGGTSGGAITGTVGGGGGGSSGGGIFSSGGGSGGATGAGMVLGASTGSGNPSSGGLVLGASTGPQAPGFPNAGFPPRGKK